MPTILTHAVAGAGVAVIVIPHPSITIVALSAALGALPDIDTAGLYFGVSYRSFWGHRGFTHSLSCALLVSLLVAMLSTAGLTQAWWELWPVLFLGMMLHGLLDGCTNGGLGVAFFSPFDRSRYFLPWRPIQVSTIGLPSSGSFLFRVLVSEVCWVWLPLAVLIGIRLAATAIA